MVETFFLSDTHLGHSNILGFLKDDGTKLRDFSSIEEHDEFIIDNWNKTVKPSDKVYHLGDVVINRRCLPLIARLNGHKRLVRGNHDIFRTSEYLEYFDEIYGCRILDNMIFTHIPIHSQEMRRFTANIHGHLHAKEVLASGYIDTNYLCISCEKINYTPISLDEIKQKLKYRIDHYEE